MPATGSMTQMYHRVATLTQHKEEEGRQNARSSCPKGDKETQKNSAESGM